MTKWLAPIVLLAAVSLSIGPACSDNYKTIHVNGASLIVDDHGNFILEKPRCPFVFSKELERRLLPILQREFHSDIQYYNVDDPAVVLTYNDARLSYLSIVQGKDGSREMNENRFVIVLNVCTKQFEKSYSEPATP